MNHDMEMIWRAAMRRDRMSPGFDMGLLQCGRLGPIPVKITLNGDPYVVDGPLTVATLLAHLDIDARRVAVEHNLMVLKRATFERAEIREGDQIEIVNFVGGG
jgi:thiamine biosynthesis protein ThiS